MPASAGALRYNGAQPMGQPVNDRRGGGDGRCPLEMPRAHHRSRYQPSVLLGYLRNGMLGSDIARDASGHTEGICYNLWYVNPYPIDMPDAASIDYLAIGTEIACAILDTGRLACWGRNDYGQAGSERQASASICLAGACEVAPRIVPVNMGRLVSVTVGGDHVCAVNQRGLLYCWGLNDRDQTGLPSDERPCANDMPCVRQATQVLDLPPIIDVVAGRSHTCAPQPERTGALLGGQPEGTAGYRLGRRRPRRRGKDPLALRRGALGSGGQPDSRRVLQLCAQRLWSCLVLGRQQLRSTRRRQLRTQRSLFRCKWTSALAPGAPLRLVAQGEQPVCTSSSSTSTSLLAPRSAA